MTIDKITTGDPFNGPAAATTLAAVVKELTAIRDNLRGLDGKKLSQE